MLLQLTGVVIARQIEIVEPRDDTVVHDFYDVWLLQILGHAVDRAAVFSQRRHPDALAVTAHHLREIEIDFVTGAVRYQCETIAIANLTSHTRNADGRFGAAANFCGPLGSTRDLHPPETRAKRGQPDQHQKGNQLNTQTRNAGTTT